MNLCELSYQDSLVRIGSDDMGYDLIRSSSTIIDHMHYFTNINFVRKGSIVLYLATLKNDDHVVIDYGYFSTHINNWHGDGLHYFQLPKN